MDQRTKRNLEPREALAKPWIIRDWARNLMGFGRFETFDDAEEFLCVHLDENYETDRQEYNITKDTK